MKLYSLANKIASRFGFMDPSELRELDSEAMTWYDGVLADAVGKISENARRKDYNANGKPEGEERVFQKRSYLTLTMKEKIVQNCNQWYVRYLLVGLFIWLVPTIRRFMNDDPMDRGGSGANGRPGGDNFEDVMRWYFKEKYNQKL